METGELYNEVVPSAETAESTGAVDILRKFGQALNIRPDLLFIPDDD